MASKKSWKKPVIEVLVVESSNLSISPFGKVKSEEKYYQKAVRLMLIPKHRFKSVGQFILKKTKKLSTRIGSSFLKSLIRIETAFMAHFMCWLKNL